MVREEKAPFTNRIHIHDLVAVCIAAMEQGKSGELYNVSNGRPSTMILPAFPGHPRFPSRRESRRLDNRKMLDDLSVVLRYPDLETGLPCSLLS